MAEQPLSGEVLLLLYFHGSTQVPFQSAPPDIYLFAHQPCTYPTLNYLTDITALNLKWCCSYVQVALRNYGQ